MKLTGYVKIALFFIVLGIAGGVYIVTSANNLNDFNTNEYETIVTDATGLTTRSKVYQAGVIIGRVKGVTLSENTAVLRVAILKDIPVREGAVITRKASSILGTSILALEPGGTTLPVIPPGGRIRSAKDASDMSAVMDTVQDLSGQISSILRDFQQNQLLLLSISLETFNSIAQKLDANTDAELERVSRILESIAYISEEIVRGQGNISQAIFDDQLYVNLLSASYGTETAIFKLQDALESINSVALSAGTMFESATVVIDNAGTIIDNAGTIVEQAVGLGVQVDTFGSYFTQANQVQAGASIRIIPKSNDRWYRVGVSSIPNGHNTRTVTNIYDSAGVLEKYEDTTVTNYSTVAIDAELARIIGLVTIRGGLIENSGGVGVDVYPLNWIGVSGELFNFRTGAAPNLRGTVTFYPFFDPDSDKPWNWLYLKGGINNTLSSSRDFFVGGGVRFNDREVKGLVGLIPALN
ncbi:MAG: MlaD family protein [Treponema sp.]|nr:MlaD family protein [Treponema sp.]